MNSKSTPFLLFSKERHRLLDLLIVVSVFVLLAIAVVYRLIAIESIPGISGDEAWYGVEMAELKTGGEVNWRTPQGNLLNPFHSGIVFLLQVFSPPSFWILRAPALIAGIFLILLSFLLIKRVADLSTALVMVILTAVLPVNIAYSRYGWDASQSTLASLIVIYFALRGHWYGLALSFLVALVIHPTNVFLAPIVLSIGLVQYWKGRKRKIKKYSLVKIFTVLLIILPMLFWVFLLARFRLYSISIMLSRLVDPQGWKMYTLYFGRLISGLTIYQYIAGSGWGLDSLYYDLVFWSVFLPVVFFGLVRLIIKKKYTYVALAVGLLISLLSFYFVVGMGGILPHYERYAQWIIIPSVFLVAICIRALMLSSISYRAWVLFVCLLGFVMLGSFGSNYFVKIVSTGGLSHRTFRTASVEPKKQALLLISDDIGQSPYTLVVVEDWWLYWPIRYLSLNAKNIDVQMLSERINWNEYLDSALRSGGYVVGFVGGPIEQYLEFEFKEEFHSRLIDGFGSRPVIGVWNLDREG